MSAGFPYSVHKPIGQGCYYVDKINVIDANQGGGADSHMRTEPGIIGIATCRPLPTTGAWRVVHQGCEANQVPSSIFLLLFCN